MTTPTLTKVPVSKLLAICEKLGLEVKVQPSQHQVRGANGEKFYFANPKVKEGSVGKTNFCQLSGHTSSLAVAWEEIYPGKKSPSTKITQVIDFRQPEKLILRAFFKIAKGIAAKPASTPASTPEANPGNEEVPSASSEPVAQSA